MQGPLHAQPQGPQQERPLCPIRALPDIMPPCHPASVGSIVFNTLCFPTYLLMTTSGGLQHARPNNLPEELLKATPR